MFDLAEYTKDKGTRQILFAIGVFTAGLVVVHYWKQIQLSNARLKKYEESEEKSK